MYEPETSIKYHHFDKEGIGILCSLFYEKKINSLDFSSKFVLFSDTDISIDSYILGSDSVMYIQGCQFSPKKSKLTLSQYVLASFFLWNLAQAPFNLFWTHLKYIIYQVFNKKIPI